MEFGYSDEEELLVETVERIIQDAAKSTVPLSETQAVFAVLRRLGAAGLLGVDVPLNLGGSGGSALDGAIVGLVAGRGSITSPLTVPPLSEGWRALWLVAQAGDVDLLEALQSGDELGVALDGRCDLSASGVSGRYPVVPYGDLVAHFIVRTSSGIVRVQACDALVQSQPATGPMPVASVMLQAASFIPLDLTDFENAWSLAGSRGRTVRAAMAVGGAESALAYAIEYVKQRRQFGRPIGSFQSVQHRLADCATAVEQARLLVFRVASELENTRPDGIESLIASTLAFALTAYESVAKTACQVLGGYGFTLDYDAQVHLRLAKSWTLLEPPQWWDIGERAIIGVEPARG